MIQKPGISTEDAEAASSRTVQEAGNMTDFESSLPKHYCIISGTGRAGTTLLARVLSRAGLDTGFNSAFDLVDPLSHAGLELDPRLKPDCYIVKSPWIATYIEDIVSRDDIVIDHAIICIRDLFEAAESRRRVQSLSGQEIAAPGGLWITTDPKKQEAVLLDLFYRLIFNLACHDIPITFLHFPRFARDSAYLAEKLSQVFPAVGP